MDGIPRTSKAVWAATCQHSLAGGFQGVIMISKLQ
jgi:hypothetical protein